MNIQDVAEFLDLVKNPEKYEALLERLVNEQMRLKAVIETVGEVSEISQIKEDMIKAEQKADSEYISRMTMLNAQQDQDILAHQVKMAAVAKEQQQYEVLVAEQKALVAETKVSHKLSKQLEKDSINKAADLESKLVAVSTLQQEYEEKVAKLRSVMV